jgi:hypothetical protein
MVTQLDPLRTYPYRYRAAGKHLYPFFWALIVEENMNVCTVNSHNSPAEIDNSP